jgi:hypothetical protein
MYTHIDFNFYKLYDNIVIQNIITIKKLVVKANNNN